MFWSFASASHTEHNVTEMPDLKEHIPLAPLTTFHIGGRARYFLQIETPDHLTGALACAKEKQLPIFVLGGGSNLLVTGDVDALVLKIELTGIEIQNDLVIAGAGESWDGLVKRACEANLWGIENLSGIPGTVGGAVYGNIGAYGQALSQRLEWVEVLDTQSGDSKKMSNAECEFDYRKSTFNIEAGTSRAGVGLPFISPERGVPAKIILRAAFRLSKVAVPELSYKDLKERFNNVSPDIAAIRQAVLEIRRDKFPDLSVEGTAGSFFKNPIVDAEAAQALKKKYPDLPLFVMPETSGAKVPLAWMLDKIMGLRGKKIGGARLFERQPLVIAVEKNCSAADVLALAAFVEAELQKKIGIRIEKEVKII